MSPPSLRPLRGVQFTFSAEKLRADLRALTGAALDVEEAAEYLCLGKRTLNELVAQGRIPYIMVNVKDNGKRCGRMLFDIEDLKRFMHDNKCRAR